MYHAGNRDGETIPEVAEIGQPRKSDSAGSLSVATAASGEIVRFAHAAIFPLVYRFYLSMYCILCVFLLMLFRMFSLMLMILLLMLIMCFLPFF